MKNILVLATALIIGAFMALPTNQAFAAPAISVQKTTTTPSVNAGSTASYQITVQYTGDTTAQNVIVQERLSQRFQFQSSNPTPASTMTNSDGSTTIRWNLGNLNPNQTSVINYSATLMSGLTVNQQITNFAEVTGDNFPTISSNTVAVQAQVSGPSIIISKTPNSSSVNAGSNVTYDISVQNVGSQAANNVVITDVLSPTLSYVSASPTPASVTTNGQNQQVLSWNAGSLSPGTSFSITETDKVSSGAATGTNLENTITVTGSNFTDVDATAVISITSGTSPSPTPSPSPGTLPRTGIDLSLLIMLSLAGAGAILIGLAGSKLKAEK